MEEATFGAGCFWCVEACFKELVGVEDVFPGYAGGHVDNPSYEAVCNGTTGHAEVIRIVFNPDLISYDKLLEVFWFIHNPTQLNRQGNDIGTQYRSVIFYHSEIQANKASESIRLLEEEKVWNAPIVTEIIAVNNFYRAENYHHDYLQFNPQNPYCQSVVRPKVDKFKKVFEQLLK